MTTTARANPRVTFLVLALAVSSYSLLQSMTVPALPQIQEHLDTDQATVSWVLTAFLLSASVATPIMGRLGDSYGKRRMLVVSLVILTVGSLAAAAAPTIELMILARVLQGVGGGTIPLAFGIIRDELPAKRIPGAISLVSSLLAVGFGVGIVVTGPILDHLGYPWLFLLPACWAALGAALTLGVVPESPVRSRERVGILPGVALAGWLVALLLGVSKATTWGWLSPAVLGLFAVAAVMFAAWILAERRAAVPVVDLRMMRLRGVWTSNLVALLIGVAMYGSFVFLPQFNQTPSENGYGFGASVSEAGFMMLPAAAGSFVIGLFAAAVARRIGTRAAIALGCLATSVGLFAAAFAHEHAWQLYAVGAATGVGTGLAFACLSNAVVNAVPPSQTGVATGMNANLRTVGGSIGTAVTTTIVTAQLLPSGYPVESGYTIGFAVLAGSALLAALAATLIPGVRRTVLTAGADARQTVAA